MNPIVLVLLLNVVLGGVVYKEGTQLSVRPGRNNIFTVACGSFFNNQTSVSGVQPYVYSFSGIPYWMNAEGNRLTGVPPSSDQGPWEIFISYRGSIFVDSFGSAKFTVVLEDPTSPVKPQAAQQPRTNSNGVGQAQISVDRKTESAKGQKKESDPNAITYFEGSMDVVSDPTAKNYVLLVPLIGKPTSSKLLAQKSVTVVCTTEQFQLRQVTSELAGLSTRSDELDAQMEEAQLAIDKLNAQIGSVKLRKAAAEKRSQQISKDLAKCQNPGL